MEWLSENKEWVFSGIGVVAITLLISFIIWTIKKKNTASGIIQNQTSGDNSMNYQSGRDIHIGK
jgi:hypothetical protein